MSDSNFLIQNEDRSPQWDPKIKEEMDKQFWEGFDAAIEMVNSVLENSEVISTEGQDYLKEEILDSVELYKKDE